MPELLVDERIRADGVAARLWLTVVGDRFTIHCDDGSIPRGAPLSAAALDRVMTRYGRELESEFTSPDGSGAERLELGGFVLRRWRYRAAVDAIGRDYLVWEAAGRHPVAALSSTIGAVLHYLALQIAPQKTDG